MVQLKVSDNPKDHLDQKPIAEAPSTVVVLPQTAPPRAKSSCCTRRVKISVVVVCFVGTLAILGCLVGFRLYRRYGCDTRQRIDDGGIVDKWHGGDWADGFDGDHDFGMSADDQRDGRHHPDGDMDRDGHDQDGGRRGGHGGGHSGGHSGGHDGDHDGDHDGGRRGGDHDGGHHDGGPPPPAPPPY